MASLAGSRVTARRGRFALAACGAAVLLFGLVDASAARPGAGRPAAHRGARLLGMDHARVARPSAPSLRYSTFGRGRLLPGLDRSRRAGFPSSGDRVPGGTGGEIYAMNADGSGQVNLTNNPNADDGYADWSPDGAKIAFTQISADAEIFAMNADGSNQTDLSNDPATADIDPVWSPDGTKIAWARATDTSDYDIWVMHADGTNQTQLTTDPGFDAYPAWSPDGTKIAFAAAELTARVTSTSWMPTAATRRT